MANVLDFVEPGPLLSDEVVKPPIVSKATVQRCIAALAEHWTSEKYDAAVEIFQKKWPHIDQERRADYLFVNE